MLSLTRQLTQLAKRQSVRCFSAGTDFIKIEKDDEGIAVVSLNKPPVNSLNLDLLTQFHDSIIQLEKEKCKGIVLTSEAKTVFSAGLDITEMYKPDMERAKKFWSQLQDTWLKLYTTPIPTVAAISGHSPAGGCMMAMGCEYRIMVGPKFTIGLNETQLGIIAPYWFQASMKNVIGTRQAELALITGKLFTVDEAFKIGLIDQVVQSKEIAIEKAKEFLEQQTYLPAMARSMTKIHYRKDIVDWMKKNKEADIKIFLEFISQPMVQKGLEIYLASLKSK